MRPQVRILGEIPVPQPQLGQEQEIRLSGVRGPPRLEKVGLREGRRLHMLHPLCRDDHPSVPFRQFLGHGDLLDFVLGCFLVYLANPCGILAGVSGRASLYPTKRVAFLLAEVLAKEGKPRVQVRDIADMLAKVV